MFCAQCGTGARPGVKFCARCGAPMVEAGEPLSEPSLVETTPPRESLPSFYSGSPSPRQPGRKPGRSRLYAVVGVLVLIILIGGVIAGWLLGRSSSDTVNQTVTSTTTVAATLASTTSSMLPVSTSSTTLALSTEELVAKVQPNVVLIETGSGSGTGFLVGKEEVMTAAHVVEGSVQVSVQYGQGQRVTGTVTYLDSNRGLALIAVPGFNGQPLPFFQLGTLKAGSECLVIGSPLGLDQSVSRGIVSNPDRDYGGVRLIQIDAPVNPGNSGGPIINDEGQVVGIVTLKITDAEGMGFGVAYDELRAFLTECRNGNWAYIPGQTGTTQGSASSGRSGTWTRTYGWTVVVYSLSEAEGGLAEAERRAGILVSRGFPAGVLYSSDFRSLNPGYWVTYSGEFDSESQAQAHAKVLRGAGYSDSYQREVAR